MRFLKPKKSQRGRKGLSDITALHSFTLYYPRNFSYRGHLPELVSVHGLLGYRMTKEWYRLLPDLKGFISEWHLVFRDVWIVPFDFKTWEGLERHLAYYFRETKTCLKGALIFKDRTFAVVLAL